MKTALVWFRRDLRVHDNPALARAAEAAERVVAVYVHAPAEEEPWTPGAASRWWLHHALAALDGALRERGGALLLLRGDSLASLRALARDTGATAVYWNRLYEPAARARDARVEAALRADGLETESFGGHLLREPGQILNGSGQPYRVFTPFWKALQPELHVRRPLAAPRVLAAPSRPAAGVSLEALQLLPKIPWDRGFAPRWTPGEAGALARLRAFAREDLADYPRARDRPAVDGTSSLSPHLHFGELTPAQVAARCALAEGAAREGAGSFLREIAWREFAHHLLFHFPHTPHAPLDGKFADFPWRKNHGADLRRWQRGETGIPLVDAGLRELWTTGWMHNRVRMVVASFLTKNLLIPWQEGARWFWDTLVDADLANNTLGWQWVAGCGADAAPYFRVFNPVLQGEKFGAEHYIRRWVPELKALPDHLLHEPWKVNVLDYPPPMVDLKASRERALAAYKKLRD